MIYFSFHLKIFLGLALLLSFCETLFSQEYIPMNFNDGIWIEEYFEPPGNTEIIQKNCLGDTLIGNQLYYKLFEQKIVVPYLGSIDTTEKVFLGFIGNSSEKIVRYISKGEVDPITIYNFDLNIGDTIVVEFDSFIIGVIDSVEICGRYHKRYSESGQGYPSDPWSNALIEGIGYSNGLLGFSGSFNNGGEFSYILRCYSERASVDCENRAIFANINSMHPELKIFPNPVRNQINIRSDRLFSKIKVYDIYGREVYSENTLFTSYESLTIGDLSPGLYLISVQFTDHSHSFSRILKL